MQLNFPLILTFTKSKINKYLTTIMLNKFLINEIDININFINNNKNHFNNIDNRKKIIILLNKNKKLIVAILFE